MRHGSACQCVDIVWSGGHVCDIGVNGGVGQTAKNMLVLNDGGRAGGRWGCDLRIGNGRHVGDQCAVDFQIAQNGVLDFNHSIGLADQGAANHLTRLQRDADFVGMRMRAHAQGKPH